MFDRGAGLGIACAALTVLVAACGGSGAARAHSPSTTSAGPNPNATEAVAPGDIPDTQAFTPFAGRGFTISVPEGWSRSDTTGATTFADHYNSVVIESTQTATMPTVAGVQSTLVPRLRTSVAGFRLSGVTTVPRSAGTPVRVTYRALSAPSPVTGKRVAVDVERYEFWRNGTQVAVTLSGAHGADNVDPWKKITNSLAWSA